MAPLPPPWLRHCVDLHVVMLAPLSCASCCGQYCVMLCSSCRSKFATSERGNCSEYRARVVRTVRSSVASHCPFWMRGLPSVGIILTEVVIHSCDACSLQYNNMSCSVLPLDRYEVRICFAFNLRTRFFNVRSSRPCPCTMQQCGLDISILYIPSTQTDTAPANLSTDTCANSN